jgi:DNA-binding NarL/FixJ family response regulator
MHKMSLSVHKSVPSKITYHSGAAKEKENISREKETGGSSSKINTDALSTKITVLDIERENRLSKVTSLYSKGLNQEEIALELHVDQSTVSRDLQVIKQEARRQVEKYLREDILSIYDIWPGLMK